MLVKVCGIAHNEIINSLDSLSIHMLGFVFYPASKRFVLDSLDESIVDTIPESISKVGVFVNAELSKIRFYANVYKLDYIQFHGNEDVGFCQQASGNFKIIKAFRVDEKFDFEQTKHYEDFCKYFLFDTNTKSYGGSGKKFNWDILHKYNGNIPFILSGGIQPEDYQIIKEVNHPGFAGIDLNSGFELSPGIKDIKKLKPFLQTMSEIIT